MKRVLAIDAGNTRIKWALYENGAWMRQGWMATAESASLHLPEDLSEPDRIVISNVAGERVRDAIVTALTRYAGPQHWLISAAELCGVTSTYARPEQLGSDRWAALIGARYRYAAPCVVVNAGTTMTVDALSGEGVFLGGCIVPGLALMQDALARNTAQLVRTAGQFHYFPDNTADAIVSGAVNALAGAVDRVMSYMQQTAEQEPVIVLSGGAAETLEPYLSGRVERVEHLVLEGLLQVGLEQEQEAQE